MGSQGGYSKAEGELPPEIVTDLLSADRRRWLIETLSEREGALPVSDLAVAVRASEEAVDPERVDVADCRGVRDEIFEEHLPKLTATGVVEYDSMLGTVRLTEHATATLQAEFEDGL